MQTKPVPNEVLLQQLKWRYATKKFDSTRKIPAADWKTLEEALVLSPSSFGLQPWKFIVITNQATKDSLVAASWGQRQIADCSHVVVFAVKKNLGEQHIDTYVARICEVRGIPKESLVSYRDIMAGSLVKGLDAAGRIAWATNQVYIALGNFMTSAAVLGIDTCPMEGIEQEKYDQILGLGPKGLTTCVVGVAGYRAADDSYAALAKVRFKTDDVIERI